jgi:hypothetical protein
MGLQASFGWKSASKLAVILLFQTQQGNVVVPF